MRNDRSVGTLFIVGSESIAIKLPVKGRKIVDVFVSKERMFSALASSPHSQVAACLVGRCARTNPSDAFTVAE
jgi:hypothetical protein